MGNIRQITEKEWDEIAVPEYIALLPLDASEFEEIYGFSPLEYVEDGLGPTKAFILQVEDSKYWLRSHPDAGDLASKLSIEVRSFEPDTEVALVKLLDALQLDKESLVHCQEYLGPAQWILYRIDDNGNEVEMNRFHRELSANGIKSIYEKRGHKQAYFVTKST